MLSERVPFFVIPYTFVSAVALHFWLWPWINKASYNFPRMPLWSTNLTKRPSKTNRHSGIRKFGRDQIRAENLTLVVAPDLGASVKNRRDGISIRPGAKLLLASRRLHALEDPFTYVIDTNIEKVLHQNTSQSRFLVMVPILREWLPSLD